MEINNKFYRLWIKRFCEKFEKGLNIVNKQHNTKAAYVILIIRDSKNAQGNIDIASNLKTSGIEYILQEAMYTCKRDKRK